VDRVREVPGPWRDIHMEEAGYVLVLSGTSPADDRDTFTVWAKENNASDFETVFRLTREGERVSMGTHGPKLAAGSDVATLQGNLHRFAGVVLAARTSSRVTHLLAETANGTAEIPTSDVFMAWGLRFVARIFPTGTSITGLQLRLDDGSQQRVRHFSTIRGV
jgi:hypothetical protein